MPNPPSLDTWTIVFALAVFQAWFLALVFWQKSNAARRGNLWLTLLLLCFGIMLAEYVLWWTRYVYTFPHAAMIGLQLPFLFGPLLWFYQRWVYERYWPQRWDWLLFLPFLLALLPFLPWYFSSAAFKAQALQQQGGYRLNPWIRQGIFFLRLAYLLGFAGWILRYAYQQAQLNPGINFWTKGLAWAFLGFALCYGSYFVLVQFAFFNLAWDYHISLAMTVFIFFIAYAGYTQPEVFEGLGWQIPIPAVTPPAPVLPSTAMQAIAQKLQELMEKEALYQEAELNLEQLAQGLNVSKYHLSQAINEVIGCNFYEYINKLRVEKAKELLLSEPSLSVKEIAYRAGFNNKVSFYNAFRKRFGVAPLVYKSTVAEN
jgi:AraC-like DNA-binding protein